MRFARQSRWHDLNASKVSRPIRRPTTHLAGRRVRFLYPERAANIRRCVLAAGALATGALPGPVRADEKGDALLRQVSVTARALAPLMGEYTVTLHEAKGDTVEQYQATITNGGIRLRGGGLLPQSMFSLFDPLIAAPLATRYLGRKTIEGETYDVVELKQRGLTFALYVGGDGLIHRARTTLGTSSFPVSGLSLDLKTGRPATRPEVTLRDGVLPPTKTDARDDAHNDAHNDAHDVDIVVTGYRKIQSKPPPVNLPPALHHLAFSSPKPGAPRVSWRVALAPDGKRVAVAFTDNTLEIIDIASGTTLATLDAPPEVMQLVFSPDGRRLATSGNRQPVTLWDAVTGRKLFALPDVNRDVWLAFTPDGRRLAYPTQAGQDGPGTLHLWDADTGKALPSPPVADAGRFAFSPDGRRLVTVSLHPDDKNQLSEKYTFKLWDTVDWKLLHTEEVRLSMPSMPVYSPDGRWIAISEYHGSTVVFSGESGALAHTLTGGTEATMTLRFSDDNKTLIAAASDSRGDSPTFHPDVTVWDTATWQVIGSGRLPIVAFPDFSSSINIAPDGKIIAVSIYGKGVFIYAVPGR